MNLESLLADIRAFEEAAFHGQSPNLAARKKAMQWAKNSCPDSNIRHILGSSVDYLKDHPEWVRAAISRARGAVDALREGRA